MRCEILTLFPEIFESFLKASLVQKALGRDLLSVQLSNIRDFAPGPHYKVDDSPYGGGGGMLLRPEPLTAAIEAAKDRLPAAQTILLTPAGRLFSQQQAEELRETDLILVCGRYEGVDQRIVELLIDREISIGDYVLMGGEVPAMVLLESILRLQDQVLGNSASPQRDSFSLTCDGSRLLEAPHYTRPEEFRGQRVPTVLLSGDHQRIAQWRAEQALQRTRRQRPDLLEQQRRE